MNIDEIRLEVLQILSYILILKQYMILRLFLIFALPAIIAVAKKQGCETGVVSWNSIGKN